MKTFVINLSHRKDRLDKFKQNNADFISYDVLKAVDGYDVSYSNLQTMGFDTDHEWIDPILNTSLTKGEVGCFLSHWEVWKKCVEMNEPVMVLEDDARITDNFSMEEIEQYLQTYSFLYLGWKEMETSVPIDGKVVQPVYPYWTLAYVITPESAEILIRQYETMQNQQRALEDQHKQLKELIPKVGNNNTVNNVKQKFNVRRN